MQSCAGRESTIVVLDFPMSRRAGRLCVHGAKGRAGRVCAQAGDGGPGVWRHHRADGRPGHGESAAPFQGSRWMQRCTWHMVHTLCCGSLAAAAAACMNSSGRAAWSRCIHNTIPCLRQQVLLTRAGGHRTDTALAALFGSFLNVNAQD